MLDVGPIVLSSWSFPFQFRSTSFNHKGNISSQMSSETCGQPNPDRPTLLAVEFTHYLGPEVPEGQGVGGRLIGLFTSSTNGDLIFKWLRSGSSSRRPASSMIQPPHIFSNFSSAGAFRSYRSSLSFALKSLCTRPGRTLDTRSQQEPSS